VQFTDEASLTGGATYDESHPEAYLAAHASRPAGELVRGLHAESGFPHADDITMLALRRHA
jgi:hypothetical protein